MGVQLLALRGQLNALARPHEQRAVQLALEVLYGAGDVRLIVHQRFRRLGYAPVFRHVVKYPVIFKADIHVFSPYVIIVPYVYYILSGTFCQVTRLKNNEYPAGTKKRTVPLPCPSFEITRRRRH